MKNKRLIQESTRKEGSCGPLSDVNICIHNILSGNGESVI